jgi:hypothetical protein
LIPQSVRQKWLKIFRHNRIKFVFSSRGQDNMHVERNAHASQHQTGNVLAITDSADETEVPATKYFNSQGDSLKPSEIISQAKDSGDISSDEEEESPSEQVTQRTTNNELVQEKVTAVDDAESDHEV